MYEIWKANHQTDLNMTIMGPAMSMYALCFWNDVSLIIQDHQGCQRDWIGDCCLPGSSPAKQICEPQGPLPLCRVLSPLLSPQRV